MRPQTRATAIGTVLCVAIVGITLPLLRPIVGSDESTSQSRFLYAKVPQTALPSLPISALAAEKVRIPIVVYHIVRPSYPNDSKEVKDMALTPEIFDAQMQYLADAEYHVVSFGDLENYFKNGTNLPTRPIIISFDDGWRNQFEYGFPILKKYHYTATFFIFTNGIGNPNFVSWEDLRALRDAGITIASHSRSHPYLTTITDPTALWDEIYGSKVMLEKNLGVTVNEFAYPFGRFDATTTALVVKAGYASARGDLYYGAEQSGNSLYDLSAMNAPTTMALFSRMFPSESGR